MSPRERIKLQQRHRRYALKADDENVPHLDDEELSVSAEALATVPEPMRSLLVKSLNQTAALRKRLAQCTETTVSEAQSPRSRRSLGETGRCGIGAVFGNLMAIKGNRDCRAGCAGGSGLCPTDWYPSGQDECSAECGAVFEPFWDTCGSMLVMAGMGGIDEMSEFYDHCLEALYPPGLCGAFCNDHTYDCFLAEVHEACCDEGGRNCDESMDVPRSCPVGCAVVFPEFLETCREHVQTQTTLNEPDFEAFEQQCMDQDGLAVVEYAISMQRSGCVIDLGGAPAEQQGHRLRLRRLQAAPLGQLGQRLGSEAPECRWDSLDGFAADLDTVCCGSDGADCPSEAGVALVPRSCNAACAVAMHSFVSSCGSTLRSIFAADGSFAESIEDFERSCLDDADAEFFLQAIMSADCSHASGAVLTPPPPAHETVPALPPVTPEEAAQQFERVEEEGDEQLPVVFVASQVKFIGDIDTIPDGSLARSEFEQNLRYSLASTLGDGSTVTPDMIFIDDVREGDAIAGAMFNSNPAGGQPQQLDPLAPLAPGGVDVRFHIAVPEVLQSTTVSLVTTLRDSSEVIEVEVDGVTLVGDTATIPPPFSIAGLQPCVCDEPEPEPQLEPQDVSESAAQCSSDRCSLESSSWSPVDCSTFLSIAFRVPAETAQLF